FLGSLSICRMTRASAWTRARRESTGSIMGAYSPRATHAPGGGGAPGWGGPLLRPGGDASVVVTLLSTKPAGTVPPPPALRAQPLLVTGMEEDCGIAFKLAQQAHAARTRLIDGCSTQRRGDTLTGGPTEANGFCRE